MKKTRPRYDTFEILKNGFDSAVSYSDGKPLFSASHSIRINGIEVTGLWRNLLDTIHSKFIDILDDGSTMFISPQHESDYKEIRKIFDELFLKFNKKNK